MRALAGRDRPGLSGAPQALGATGSSRFRRCALWFSGGRRVAFCLVMAGTGVNVLAVACAGLSYRDTTGERYSLLNHFISELGELAVSRGAWAFNGSLALAGLLFLPFCVLESTIIS